MIFPISALVTFGGEEIADILQAFVKEEGNASVLTPEQKAAIATVVEICQDGEFRSMSVEFEAGPGRPGAARPISKKTCIAVDWVGTFYATDLTDVHEIAREYPEEKVLSDWYDMAGGVGPEALSLAEVNHLKEVFPLVKL